MIQNIDYERKIKFTNYCSGVTPHLNRKYLIYLYIEIFSQFSPISWQPNISLTRWNINDNLLVPQKPSFVFHNDRVEIFTYCLLSFSHWPKDFNEGGVFTLNAVQISESEVSLFKSFYATSDSLLQPRDSHLHLQYDSTERWYLLNSLVTELFTETLRFFVNAKRGSLNCLFASKIEGDSFTGVSVHIGKLIVWWIPSWNLHWKWPVESCLFVGHWLSH